MIVVGLDPGTHESALVVWDGTTEQILSYNTVGNATVLDLLDPFADKGYVLVIEKIASYGMAVGASVFETVFWSGRFCERFKGRVDRITRADIKLHLCHSKKAKDGNIRQALIDRFGEVGTKKNPGRMYGMATHLWAALAVAVSWHDMLGTKPSEMRKGVVGDF